MIDHCVSAFLERKEWELYRIYMTDALKAKWELNYRYKSLFDPPETRTAAEVISHMKDKIRQVGGDQDESIQPLGNSRT